jgi:REP element-mobilizing transposase RayT
MSTPVAIYTPDNCHPAYQLNWSLAVFWNHPERDSAWFADLQQATEKDGVRLLEHRILEPGVSQFFVSTTPQVAPPQLVRSVKGRLQYLLRDRYPSAFRRHYGLRSVGKASRRAIEEYVRGQVEHHPSADPRVQHAMARFQIHCPDVDLSQPRRTAHGQFWYNLHLVFVHAERWREVREAVLDRTQRTILAAATKHGHLLSEGGIVPDHIHSTFRLITGILGFKDLAF